MGRVKLHWILATLILTSALAGCFWDDDADGDGWSDEDENAAGSDPNDADETPDDLDGDGYSNELEKKCGSDERHGPNEEYYVGWDEENDTAEYQSYENATPLDNDGDNICAALDLDDNWDSTIIFGILTGVAVIALWWFWFFFMGSGEEEASELLAVIYFFLGLFFTILIFPWLYFGPFAHMAWMQTGEGAIDQKGGFMDIIFPFCGFWVVCVILTFLFSGKMEQSARAKKQQEKDRKAAESAERERLELEKARERGQAELRRMEREARERAAKKAQNDEVKRQAVYKKVEKNFDRFKDLD